MSYSEKVAEYEKEFGMVGGIIPANAACPFLGECREETDDCPSLESMYKHGCSCAVARYNAVSYTRKDGKLVEREHNWGN